MRSLVVGAGPRRVNHAHRAVAGPERQPAALGQEGHTVDARAGLEAGDGVHAGAGGGTGVVVAGEEEVLQAGRRGLHGGAALAQRSHLAGLEGR